MSKGKKTRQKLDPKRHDASSSNNSKKEDKDWGFDEIAKSKTRHR